MKKLNTVDKLSLINVVISLLLISFGIILIILSLINIIIFSTYNVEKVKKNDINQSIYINYPTKGDYIGTITFPTLNETLPIYEGTSNDELKKGVGHFIQSVLPGDHNNSVISGHRDTVFKNLGDLKIADTVIVKTTAGEFFYKVIEIKIVKKNDRTVITPTKAAILTITTCYPFNYIGLAPERYIVSAVLIKT